MESFNARTLDDSIWLGELYLSHTQGCHTLRLPMLFKGAKRYNVRIIIQSSTPNFFKQCYSRIPLTMIHVACIICPARQMAVHAIRQPELTGLVEIMWSRSILFDLRRREPPTELSNGKLANCCYVTLLSFIAGDLQTDQTRVVSCWFKQIKTL